MKTVKFIKKYAPYNQGEVAGFQDFAAHRLVDEYGVAVFLKPDGSFEEPDSYLGKRNLTETQLKKQIEDLKNQLKQSKNGLAPGTEQKEGPRVNAHDHDLGSGEDLTVKEIKDLLKDGIPQERIQALYDGELNGQKRDTVLKILAKKLF